jgi:hypothetical protein
MAAAPKLQHDAEPPDDGLDAQLRALFDGLLAQPVPEALLRHLEQLEDGEADQGSPA